MSPLSFYNFIKHKLFKIKTIKIILTEILVIIIVLFLLIQGLLAATFTNKILSFIILISFLSVSYLLIRATQEEIKRKIQAERLAQELKGLIKKFTPGFLLSFYHYCLTAIGAFFYGFPSEKLVVIGVTGTSGKSTVVELSSLILETAGFKVASLSSFNFKTAVFTNLSPEHIESHGSFEKYRAAKRELFKATPGIHIINIDDNNAEYFWKIPAEKKMGFGIKNQELGIKNIKLETNYSSFIVYNSLLLIHLPGKFNLYNALAAIEIARSQGVSLEICQRALEKIKVIPGRMEVVVKDPFIVIVDYAHTPEALKQAYETLKNPKFQNSKLICVLGSCGGGRDKGKRPVLGKIASQYCDKAIITNEDPYNEEPMDIINQVAGDTKAEKILDRKEAIEKALQSARAGDIVIITGKGSEPWMCVKNNKKIPWSDKKIALDFLKDSTKIEL